jgi:hypothetical protein
MTIMSHFEGALVLYGATDYDFKVRLYGLQALLSMFAKSKFAKRRLIPIPSCYKSTRGSDGVSTTPPWLRSLVREGFEPFWRSRLKRP